MVVSPYTKLKVRRRVRKTQKKATEAGDVTADHIEKHVVNRWQNLKDVRRFVFGWLLLVVLLISGVFLQNTDLRAFYETQVPADGGTYVEGVVGEVTNLNPIFASSPADKSASRLIFDSLFEYDDQNQLIPKMATDYEIDEDGTTYTVFLRDDLVWHDGTPITAEDVVFTIESIQHPDSRSPFNSSWQDVTVQALDENTLTFTIPNPFIPFINSLTFGVIPQHILGDLLPNELRAAEYNLQPTVGSGPFVFEQLLLEGGNSQVGLSRNNEYREGAPRIEQFIIRSFEDHESMVTAFNKGQLTAAAGLRTFDGNLLTDDQRYVSKDVALNNIVFLFFKTSDQLLKKKDFRTALTQAIDQDAIFNKLGNHYAVSSSPLLPEHIGYSRDNLQKKFDREQAEKKLDKLGWKKNDEGIRTDKDGEELVLELVSQNSDEYPLVVEELQMQMAEIGIKLNPILVNPGDLQQSHIVPHNYQSILISVTLGIDPDVFVYWHSSQAGVRGFNLSEYENKVADAALESGRTRDDDELREVKYETFLNEWIKDAPAVSLYRPGFSYVQRSDTTSFEATKLVEPADRFFNVNKWTVNTKTVPRQY